MNQFYELNRNELNEAWKYYGFNLWLYEHNYVNYVDPEFYVHLETKVQRHVTTLWKEYVSEHAPVNF